MISSNTIKNLEKIHVLICAERVILVDKKRDMCYNKENAAAYFRR